MNENPYRPPLTAVTQSRVPPTRRFRWGIIPAVYFWLLLLAAVLGSGECVILTLRSWRRFAELWSAGERSIPLLAMALPLLSVCVVIAVYSCANAWLKGHWLKAVLLSVIVVPAMPLADTLTTYLIPTVYLRILFTNQIPFSVHVRDEEWHCPPGLVQR